MMFLSPVCPGRVGSPCSNHGKCDDGHLGNGTCTCDAGFGGVACELCSDGFYGSTCKGEQRSDRFLFDVYRFHSSLFSVWFQPATVQNTDHVTTDVKVQVHVSVMPAGPENAVRPRKVSSRGLSISYWILTTLDGRWQLCLRWSSTDHRAGSSIPDPPVHKLKWTLMVRPAASMAALCHQCVRPKL